MKIAIFLSLIALIIGGALFGAAFAFSEDQYLIASWWAFGSIPFPVLLVLAYRGAVWGAQLAASAEARRVRKAEARVEERRKAKEKAALAASEPEEVKFTAPPPTMEEHRAAVVMEKERLEHRPWPTHREVRLGLAVACLLALLVFPQYQLFVPLNGYKILSFTLNSLFEAPGRASRSVDQEPRRRPGLDGDTLFVDSSRPKPSSGANDGVMGAIAIFIAPIAAVLLMATQIVLAYQNRPRTERWVGVATLGALLLTFCYMSFQMGANKADLEDNPFSTIVSATIGFTWGFYLVLVLTALYTAAAFGEAKKRARVVSPV